MDLVVYVFGFGPVIRSGQGGGGGRRDDVAVRSFAELEFRVIAQGLCELLWLKIILDDLRIK